MSIQIDQVWLHHTMYSAKRSAVLPVLQALPMCELWRVGVGVGGCGML